MTSVAFSPSTLSMALSISFPLLLSSKHFILSIEQCFVYILSYMTNFGTNIFKLVLVFVLIIYVTLEEKYSSFVHGET